MNPNHPRFGQRLFAFGGALFCFGITARLIEHRIPLIAAWLVAAALLARFVLELRITGEEREIDVAPTLSQISLLNQFCVMASFFGLLGYMRER